MTSVLAGIFVGGAATRMGGVPKGMLPSPEGPTVVERLAGVLREIDSEMKIVLVGSAASAYERLGVEVLLDEPPGIGPLGGVRALLGRALGRSERAVALACDMPFVSRALLSRLMAESPSAPVLAPKRGDLWEPLCARYEPASVLPIAMALTVGSDHSLQRLLARAGAVALPLSPAERDQLKDWDSPEDLPHD